MSEIADHLTWPGADKVAERLAPKRLHPNTFDYLQPTD